MTKKIVIVGGVAGGMSCAARIRRLDDEAEIVVFEKGRDVSFANCGMPYYIGGVIQDRKKMLVQTPENLHGRYALDVRVRHEVTAIHRDKKSVTVKNLDKGEEFEESYDHLVLSPGAAPFKPPIPGADQKHVFVLNDLSDMDGILEAAKTAKKTTIVGAGFIGLEMAENFRERGLEVALVEMNDQVLSVMDREMTQPLLQELKLHGVDVHLEDTVTAIEADKVVLKSGKALESDLVCLSIGVRPTSKLAGDAGVELGPRGHIHVDAHMRTSDPHIYAVGDAVEVEEWVSGETTAIALAGPANRQGRIAADNICNLDSAYRGIQGTAIVKVFNLAAGQTGLTERRLIDLGREYQRVYLHPTQHPGYYPDAKPLNMKLLFTSDGAILGAQIVGAEGVKGMIDTVATAMQGKLKVQDLEHLELAYSPQWGAAKDPLNMAGFVAANLLKGDVEMVEADAAPEDIYWVDVRTKEEIEAGMVPGAAHIPVDELRNRVADLPKDREIGVYCQVGLRGYIAYRFLKQHGIPVRSLNGGYRTWTLYQSGDKNSDAAPTAPAGDKAGSESSSSASGSSEPSTEPDPGGGKEETVHLDVCGLQCPGPIAKVKEAMTDLTSDQVLQVKSTDPGFASDIPSWCKATGNTLLEVKTDRSNYVARIRAGASQAAAKETASSAESKGTTMVLFSNDLDKALAAFIIANGSAAMGQPTTIFFTFWGLNVLRKDSPPALKKSLIERMLGFMMPRGPGRLKLSQMHMAGMGTSMIKKVMKDKNVMSLPELIASAREQGVRLVACAMSMDLMGIKEEELVEGVEIAGVGNYLGTAQDGNTNLFI